MANALIQAAPALRGRPRIARATPLPGRRRSRWAYWSSALHWLRERQRPKKVRGTNAPSSIASNSEMMVHRDHIQVLRHFATWNSSWIGRAVDYSATSVHDGGNTRFWIEGLTNNIR